jgi:hypothetical protein
VDHLQQRRKQLRLSGKQKAQWDRQREHALAHRDGRDHVIDQMGSVSPMRRAPQEGQKPRRLQENATIKLYKPWLGALQPTANYR